MMWQRVFRFGRVLALTLAVASCAGVNLSEFDFGTPNPPQAPLQEPSGAALTARFGGAYNNPALQGELERIVSRLQKSTDRSTEVYRVTILNSPQINAFALENGQIFVTRGLIAYTNSADEVAAVLAHEMAHVILKHGAKRREAIDQISRNASLVRGNDSAIGPLASADILPTPKYSIAQFTQSQELEADRLGQTLMQKAGFNPHSQVDFLENIANLDRKQRRDSPQASFLSTHPSNAARLARARAFPTRVTKLNPLENERYLGLLDGMIYGEAVENGVFINNVFYHPGLKIRLDMPQNYAGENTPDAVFASGPNGELVRFDADRQQSTADLRSYMTQEWLQNIDPGQITLVQHNAHPIAWTRVSSGRVQFFFAAVGWQNNQVFRFILIAPLSDQQAQDRFLTMVKSLDSLRRSEIADLSPNRIRLATMPEAGLNALEQRLAKEAPASLGLDFVLQLNGLESKKELTQGQLLKIVSRD